MLKVKTNTNHVTTLITEVIRDFGLQHEESISTRVLRIGSSTPI